MTPWIRRLDAAFDETVDYRALVPLRIAVGPLVLLHLAPFLSDAARGRTPGDGFLVPFVAGYPQAPGPVYLALVWMTVAAALCTSVGFLTRPAAILTAGFVGYNLFLSWTHYHHNRAFLFVLLVGVAATPVGRVASVDSWLRRRRRASPAPPTGRRWPLMLLRFQLAAVYLASGFSKLVDPDWFGGVVTRLRVERYVAGSGWDDHLANLLASPAVHAVGAKVVVSAELFIGLGLLVPRLRAAAIWLAIPFHIAIQLTADVQAFSFAALVALVVWVEPSGRRRTVFVSGEGGGAARLAATIRGLDWTGRFAVTRRPSAAWEGEGSPGLAVAAGDAWHEGRAAVREILTRLPLTFWFVAPFNLPGLRSRWDGKADSTAVGAGPG